MKRVIIISSVFLISIWTFAQDIIQERVYKYDTFVAIDENYNEVDRMPLNGIIVFSKAAGMDYVSITLEDEVTFNGPIKTKKIENIDGYNVVSNIYLFTSEFYGQQVPLQLFENYHISKSSIIPNEFYLEFLNVETGEYVQGIIFTGITRAR